MIHEKCTKCGMILNFIESIYGNGICINCSSKISIEEVEEFIKKLERLRVCYKN